MQKKGNQTWQTFDSQSLAVHGLHKVAKPCDVTRAAARTRSIMASSSESSLARPYSDSDNLEQVEHRSRRKWRAASLLLTVKELRSPTVCTSSRFLADFPLFLFFRTGRVLERMGGTQIRSWSMCGHRCKKGFNPLPHTSKTWSPKWT